MRRVFIEREKCQICLSCMIACMTAHRKEPSSDYDLYNNKSIESRNYIRYQDGNSAPVFCRHCDDPECAAACMSGALQKNPESGHVLYDKERCGQCFMCVMSCHFGLPRPDSVSRSEMVKCDFCTGIADSPSCASACPTETITVKEVT